VAFERIFSTALPSAGALDLERLQLPSIRGWERHPTAVHASLGRRLGGGGGDNLRRVTSTHFWNPSISTPLFQYPVTLHLTQTLTPRTLYLKPEDPYIPHSASVLQNLDLSPTLNPQPYSNEQTNSQPSTLIPKPLTLNLYFNLQTLNLHRQPGRLCPIAFSRRISPSTTSTSARSILPGQTTSSFTCQRSHTGKRLSVALRRIIGEPSTLNPKL